MESREFLLSGRTKVKVVGVVVAAGDVSLNSLENPFARDCGPKLLGEARLWSNASELDRIGRSTERAC